VLCWCLCDKDHVLANADVAQTLTPSTYPPTHPPTYLQGVTHRTCTGELAMVPGARDIKVVNFSLSFHGENLIEDTTLELNYGRRYGLIGRNGSGKSTFLEALAFNDLELPPHIDKYLLSTEADPSDRTAMEEVSTLAITPTHTHSPPSKLTYTPHTHTCTHSHTTCSNFTRAHTPTAHVSPPMKTNRHLA
jgi:hypothetical protein